MPMNVRFTAAWLEVVVMLRAISRAFVLEMVTASSLSGRS